MAETAREASLDQDLKLPMQLDERLLQHSVP